MDPHLTQFRRAAEIPHLCEEIPHLKFLTLKKLYKLVNFSRYM